MYIYFHLGLQGLAPFLSDLMGVCLLQVTVVLQFHWVPAMELTFPVLAYRVSSSLQSPFLLLLRPLATVKKFDL